MKLKSFGTLILLLHAAMIFGQISSEKIAQLRISKQKWVKAESTLKKSLKKDSINPEANYLYALWYVSTGNPHYDIENAHQHILTSMKHYIKSDVRQRDRMRRLPLDSMIIVQLKESIDSLAFEQAKIENSESSYQQFVDTYTSAKEVPMAIELRDEVSFLDALKINTYESFDHYLMKYPKSHRADEAKARYEKLLYDNKTRDGKLKSFVAFYENYPSSHYRDEALRHIFEISTASGTAEDYMSFLDIYGASTQYSKKARDILYHLVKDGNDQLPVQLLTDSLSNVMQLEKGFWIPFLKNAKFGFMDENGNEQIKESFEDIDEAYLCGNIEDDFLSTSSGIISRSGVLLSKTQADEVTDLGLGVLLANDQKCYSVIHKSNFMYADSCVLDARLVANHFLAIQKLSSKWELYALNGKKILNESYDDIHSVEDLVVFERLGKKSINTLSQVADAADRVPLPAGIVFDEVRKLSSDKILVKNGALEGVVDTNLEYVIPLDRQSLTLTSFGFTKRYLNRITTVGLSETIDREEYTDIKPYLNWLGLFSNEDIQLYHIPSVKMLERGLDSLWFSNRLAFAKRNDSLKVVFGGGKVLTFSAKTNVTFIKSPDSVRFFMLEEQGKQHIYDVDTGNKKFVTTCNKLEDIGYNVFLIEAQSKWGLLNAEGKSIVPTEYDAIVKSGDQFVSLLKSKKFGIYDLKNKILVKPEYERNIWFYNNSLLVAFKEGNYGFIDRHGKATTAFEFDEIRYWSDSQALVKKGFRWNVYDIGEEEVIFDKIRDYRLIADHEEEKIAIVHRENEFGVLSNTRGVVIPATFSDIINLGTADKALYFTEKHVEEADIFVVIYYDHNGKMIRREIYESDEYDLIYCR